MSCRFLKDLINVWGKNSQFIDDEEQNDVKEERLDEADISSDPELGECCATFANLSSTRRNWPTLTEFFHRYQNADKDDKGYAKNHKSIARRSFRGSPPTKVAGQINVHFRHGLRPTVMVELHRRTKTNALIELVRLQRRGVKDHLRFRAATTTTGGQIQHAYTSVPFTVPQNWASLSLPYRVCSETTHTHSCKL
uniref:DUF5726 domain-containing protein n=1 Tax=Echinococcus granulosus TaxID=6210 RepID=A0A068WYL2_ECHGR|nr:hypothetical protein EgrG_002050400 [Echinococcus granulosus]